MRRREMDLRWVMREGPAGETYEPALGRVVRHPDDVVPYLAPLSQQHQESMWVLVLDARMRLTGHREVLRGTTTSCVADPAEVARAALLGFGAAVIIAHCHPSGDTTPSPEDVDATRRIKAALDAVCVPLLDHLIVGLAPDGSVAHDSMKARGLL